MRQLEYKTCGIQPWLEGDEAMRRKAMAQLEQKRAGRTLETKAGYEQYRPDTARVLAAADRRIAEMKAEIRAMGGEI